MKGEKETGDPVSFFIALSDLPLKKLENHPLLACSKILNSGVKKLD
ncbi:MAG: hypothetical protein IJJ25_13765 [Lachnospiraceae bacterium]|nr:hypothetical protein [Lachnospiraceae bacterium]